MDIEYCSGLTKKHLTYPQPPQIRHIASSVLQNIYKKISHREQPQISKEFVSMATEQDNRKDA